MCQGKLSGQREGEGKVPEASSVSVDDVTTVCGVGRISQMHEGTARVNKDAAY